MTEAEKRLLQMTADLWNAFLDLPDRHPSDAEETQRDIHNIQNRIMARCAVRSCPDLFRQRSNRES